VVGMKMHRFAFPLLSACSQAPSRRGRPARTHAERRGRRSSAYHHGARIAHRRRSARRQGADNDALLPRRRPQDVRSPSEAPLPSEANPRAVLTARVAASAQHSGPRAAATAHSHDPSRSALRPSRSASSRVRPSCRLGAAGVLVLVDEWVDRGRPHEQVNDRQLGGRSRPRGRQSGERVGSRTHRGWRASGWAAPRQRWLEPRGRQFHACHSQ